MYIENKYYRRPATPYKATAQFGNNEFNTQEWHLNGTSACPNGDVLVKDGVIRWDGAGQNSMFGSRYKYSNFQLVYDIYDVKNVATRESNGWINAASFWQGVAFGVQGDDIETSVARRDERDCLVYFGASTDEKTGERTGKGSMGFIMAGKYIANVVLPDKYDVFSVGYTDKLTVRIVVIDGKILGKPKDEQDAARMLRMLSGRTHTVYTGLTVHADGESKTQVVGTDVTFRELTDAGYITRAQTHSEAGTFSGYDYIVHETPAASPSSGFPTMEKPTTENPTTENPTLRNTDGLSTDMPPIVPHKGDETPPSAALTPPLLGEARGERGDGNPSVSGAAAMPRCHSSLAFWRTSARLMVDRTRLPGSGRLIPEVRISKARSPRGTSSSRTTRRFSP